MHKQFYSVRFFFISLLLSICFGSTVNGQLYLEAHNTSTGGIALTAFPGTIVRYEVYIKNSEYGPFTNGMLYANIPAGTTYVPGSTTENGVPVPDVNGLMPFAGSGRLIKATSANPGALPYKSSVTIEFRTQVTANTGNISTSVTLLATTNSGPINVTNSGRSTQVTGDHNCTTIYESTSNTQPFGNPPTYPYSAIRALSTANGTGNPTIYNGATGLSYNAITGDPLPATLKNSSALASDKNSNRVYFVNNTSNPAEDLCFVDLNAKPVCARKYVGYPLETNTSAGYNINRMTFASDGYGYAITENGQDMIRFSIDLSINRPVISPLGALINDANNGANNVLAETGGDIFGDGSGKLYLIPNSGKLYRIDPATRVATYLSKISQVPAGGVNSVAVDQNGNVFIGGPYQNVFMVNFSTMTATSITSGTSNVWTSGDYTSCILPVLGPALKATKSYTNTTGRSYVASGDQIEYTIEVSNTGNMSATAAKLYDALPAGSHYVAGSTTMNGVAVADIGVSMPFAVTGGQFINTATEPAGVVVPGDANKAVIKFRVTTDAQTTICNQATVTFNDVDGSTKFAISDDPAQTGTRDATCFYSDAALPPALTATKTWRCPFTGATFVVAGDPVEYTITVTNTGGAHATGVTVYDAIPANSQYMAGTTKMNGVAVADIGGVMPFAVSGQFVNSPGQSAGVITPGAANKVTITFMVKTNPGTTVCNQATITYQHAGNNINVVTDNPATSGAQDATCFYSDVPPLGGRKAVNGTPENEQPAIIESAHVQPNPFLNDLNLQVQSNTEKAVQVSLIDFYGRTVYTTSQKLAKGTNSLKLHVPAGLSSGIYVLEVSAGNSRLLQKKLIKQ